MTLPTYQETELPLLQEIIAAGGGAKPKDIYPRMRKYFPQIIDSDLQAKLQGGGSIWTNRIQWARQSLVEKGEVHREPRGVWRVTPKGVARAKGEPTPPRGPDTGTGEPPAPPRVVADPVERLCDRLTKAQKQSSTPKNYEAALAEAFRFLGLDVREQGKPGETDLILDTYLGSESYRVIVDAKATHGDKVNDAQINWLTMNQHKSQAGAQYAVVVGVDFAGGNLLKWANEYGVALLRTADLIEVIRLHRSAPFSLIQLRPLFATPGPVQQSLQDLRLIHEATIRHWRLLLAVVQQIDSYNRFNKAGLVATPDGVQLMLYSRIASGSVGPLDPSRVPSTEDVRDAMAFLACRAVGVLKQAPEGSSGYQLTMHLDAAVQRISALAQRLEDSGSGIGAVAGAYVRGPTA